MVTTITYYLLPRHRYQPVLLKLDSLLYTICLSYMVEYSLFIGSDFNCRVAISNNGILEMLKDILFA